MLEPSSAQSVSMGKYLCAGDQDTLPLGSTPAAAEILQILKLSKCASGREQSGCQNKTRLLGMHYLPACLTVVIHLVTDHIPVGDRKRT